MNDAKFSREIIRYKANEPAVREIDEVIVEEPLEIRVGTKTLTITMRTPGDDFALAAGFLFSESVIKTAQDIDSIRFCGPRLKLKAASNIMRVTLKPHVSIKHLRLDRHFYASSSCGVCGKSSIEALAINAEPLEKSERPIVPNIIYSLPQKLRLAQTLFHATGAVHAAGLFESDGQLLEACEDVGRHNAVDKLIGRHFLRGDTNHSNRIMCISGRASFEILQKAIVARIPTIVAVGAPSSLAIDLAERFNITLIGFTSSSRFNVYSG